MRNTWKKTNFVVLTKSQKLIFYIENTQFVLFFTKPQKMKSKTGKSLCCYRFS